MELSQIDSLNKQAWESRINDSLKACDLAESAFEHANKQGYSKGIADALRTQGFCLIRLSKHKEASTCLTKAKDIYEGLDDFKGLASLYEYFGIINRSWGDFQAAIENITKAIDLSQQTDFIENEMTNHYQLGVTYRALGEYNKALESLDRSLMLSKKTNHELMKGYVINVMGSIYYKTENYTKALDYYKEGLELRKQSGDQWGIAGSLDNVGMTYLELGELNEAIEACQESLEINRKVGDKKGEGNSLMLLSQIHFRQEDLKPSLSFAKECRKLRNNLNDKKGETEVLIQIARINRKSGAYDVFDPSILESALQIVDDIGAKDLKSGIFEELYMNYKNTNQFEKSILYLEKYFHNEKSLHKDAIEQQIRNLEITHKVEESKKAAEIFRLKNVELSELYQKSEQQKSEIEITLNKLKATQSQLIQAEKMASLGELTAGIAHEIKNPLNFVNNFSEVNVELAEELLEEIENEDYEEVKAIADDIKSNQEKILHHGKRADSIVKNMLQHSRAGSGEKQATDINALADEYLRLAYHGLRAKDSNFNCKMETDLDDTIGKVNVIPQDFGRVLLNLITNAFQACAERITSTSLSDQRSTPLTEQRSAPLRQPFDKLKIKGQGTAERSSGKDDIPKNSKLEKYKPTVAVTTSRLSEAEVEIRVSDNGNGIPEDIKDKIFQPFFTTKPTGEGTGLGLSMSYDIVTKGHGGTLEVESKEDEGTEFIISLPYQN